MLELGGKINAPFTYKAFFERLGYRHVSVDWNGEHGAIVRDLRKPLNLGQFDFVSNIGTSEHVDKQEPVWRNMLEAMRAGSVLISTTPLPPDDWHWHGLWHPTREFYIQLAALNGLSIERIYESGEAPRRMIFVRATREREAPFAMPAGLLHFNPEGRR